MYLQGAEGEPLFRAPARSRHGRLLAPIDLPPGAVTLLVTDRPPSAETATAPRRPFEFVSIGLVGFAMDRGFRRSGAFFYKPVCANCRECVPIRVPVARFRASPSQRRVLRRNADVRVEAVAAADDDEHFALYERYQRERHPAKPAGDRADYERFLCDSPIPTLVLDFRVRDRLIGVSILDEKSKAKFASKYDLTFPLLADADHEVAEKYGVWQEKSRYGRKYMGIARTTYLIGPDGKVAQRWDNVKVEGHAEAVAEALAGAT